MNTTLTSSSEVEIDGYYFRQVGESFYRGCTRCGGSGHYSHNGFDSICYKCNNVTEERLGVYVGTREDAVKDAAKREKARLARIAKAERERLVLVAKQDAKVAAAKAEYPEVVAFLESVDLYEERSSFIRSMAENIQFVSANEKPFTAKMAAAVQKTLDERAAKAATTVPVIEGRIEITGTITSTKIVESDFGTAFKIVLQDDRGFRVYGSLAKSLLETFENEFLEANPEPYTYGYSVWFTGSVNEPERFTGIKGRRVTFSATVEASKDDKGFGFFSRPTKASVAE